MASLVIKPAARLPFAVSVFAVLAALFCLGVGAWQFVGGRWYWGLMDTALFFADLGLAWVNWDIFKDLNA